MALRNSPIYYQKKHYYIKMFVLNYKMEHKYVHDTFLLVHYKKLKKFNLEK